MNFDSGRISWVEVGPHDVLDPKELSDELAVLTQAAAVANDDGEELDPVDGTRLLHLLQLNTALPGGLDGLARLGRWLVPLADLFEWAHDESEPPDQLRARSIGVRFEDRHYFSPPA